MKKVKTLYIISGASLKSIQSSLFLEELVKDYDFTYE